MTHVAIVCEYATLNGGERSMLAVLDRLAGSAFSFTVLAPPEGPLADALRRRRIDHCAISLHDATGRRVPRDSAVGRIVEALASCKPDLLHANSLSMGRLTAAAAARLRIPAAAHLRDIVKLSSSAIDELNGNRLLVAVSRATRDFHVAQGMDAAKIRVIHNGIDCDAFQPRPATGGLKRALGVPEAAFLVAAIGQIGIRKGLDVLAQAAALLAQRHVSTDRRAPFHYVLIGERHSTKQESIEFDQRITDVFAQAGISHRLHRLGYRDDVAALLSEVDVLAHPSRQEPLGRVLLEAAASGVPIVATSVGGTGEILRDGYSALLVPPDDPIALADVILELTLDESLRQRLTQNARAEIVARFSIDRAAQQLADTWLQFCSE